MALGRNDASVVETRTLRSVRGHVDAMGAFGTRVTVTCSPSRMGKVTDGASVEVH